MSEDAAPAKPATASALAAEGEADLFVVYAAADEAFVRGHLVPALGLPADRVRLLGDFPLGAVTMDAIVGAVGHSRFTVVVLSPAYLRDRWALFGEQMAAHARQPSGRLIPLLLGACDVPLQLDALVALDFRDPARWQDEVDRLRRHLGGAAPAPSAAATDVPCPYPGMRPLGAAEADRIYGRDQEIEDVVARVEAGEREIYVVGPSGSGKSSLIAAGVLPRLRGSGAARTPLASIRSFRPGAHPAARLREALDGGGPAAERAIIFVDQLEELFTVASAEERRGFVAAFADAYQAPDRPRRHFLFALRADFYGAFMESELWALSASRMSRLDITPLRGAALAEAIEGPARRAGIHLEPGLVERLRADAASEPGALPLLQEALVLLWERRSQRLLRLADYEGLGRDGRSGLAVALARRADATLHALPPPEQAAARRILLRLVSFGVGGPDTRRQQAVADLEEGADAADTAASRAALRRLTEDRLLTMTSVFGTEVAVVDLAHEAILSAWPALRQWIQTRRADEERRRLFELKAREWRARGSGAASLLDAVELAEVETWMKGDAARELGHGRDVPELVEASRRSIERARREASRRRRATIGGLSILAGAASVLALVAWTRTREAQRWAADARRETSEARRMLGRQFAERARQEAGGADPLAALPLLVAARREGVEGAALGMLFAHALRHAPEITCAHPNLTGAIASPDGTRLATVGRDGTARICDGATGQPVAPPLVHGGTIKDVRFSPDGALLATAGDDGVARVWDAGTGAAVSEPIRHPGPVSRVAFSPDGRSLITVAGDNAVRVFSTRGGPPTAPPLVHPRAVLAIAISPDGRLVLSACDDGRARLWEPATARVRVLQHEEPVSLVAFSRAGDRCATAAGKLARAWDVATGDELHAGRLRHESDVRALAFSPDGSELLSAVEDHVVRWDLRQGTSSRPGFSYEGVALSFNRDATYLLVDGRGQNPVFVLDVGSGAAIHPRLGTAIDQAGGLFDGDWGPPVATFTDDGVHVVTARRDDRARAFRLPRIVVLPEADVAALSPDGTRAVTTSYQSADLWNAATGEAIALAFHRDRSMGDAAFSPNGRWVVTTAAGGARISDARTGAPVASIDAPETSHAIFNADGTRLALVGLGHLSLWSVPGAVRIGDPIEHHSISVAAFSPDSARIVTGGDDGTARIWDAATGRPQGQPLAHENAVVSLSVSPKGDVLATASHSAVRLWRMADGLPLGDPWTHPAQVDSVAFDPRGTRVVTGCADGKARVFDAPTGVLLTSALDVTAGNGSRAAVQAMFGPDGDRILVVRTDRATIFDATMGSALLMPLAAPRQIKSAAFSHDGEQILIADLRATRIWHLPVDRRSVEDWEALARCSPRALRGAVLIDRQDDLLSLAACAPRRQVADRGR